MHSRRGIRLSALLFCMRSLPVKHVLTFFSKFEFCTKLTKSCFFASVLQNEKHAERDLMSISPKLRGGPKKGTERERRKRNFQFQNQQKFECLTTRGTTVGRTRTPYPPSPQSMLVRENAMQGGGVYLNIVWGDGGCMKIERGWGSACFSIL